MRKKCLKRLRLKLPEESISRACSGEMGIRRILTNDVCLLKFHLA